MKLIEIIKALSHENRLRILNLIKDQELCVCEIEYVLEINQSNASRHLTKLKQTNLIDRKKRAQWNYYSINNNLLKEYSFLKVLIEEELDSVEILNKDRKKLKEYQNSDLTCNEIG
ncbi:MAG TPA: metalloregulator ArsR/SmtB family transcription factor [Halanaerobiales bacterium]|nr:metalloregulator ArsR/SmtB family transcription factor [Halanaerobiales bacterium]